MTYSYNYESTLTPEQMVPVIIVSTIIGIISLIALCKIFSKAGESWWKALIPIYNLYKEFELFWGQGILFLLLLVPIANIVISIIILHKMSKSFGHGAGFTLGLLFLEPIFLCILAFGSSRYIGPNGEPSSTY